MTIKTIFFDAGGTLFKPYPSVGGLYAKMAAPFGKEFDPDILEKKFQAAWQKRGGLASLGSETSEEKERHWWVTLVEEVFEPFGGMPHFEQFFEKLYQAFEEKESWEIFPEVLETLKELRSKKLTLGIVSNWDLRLHKVLKSLDLIQYFDFIVGSSYVGATKPHRKIFEEALSKSASKPHEVIHVGDSYPEDIMGAEPLGIRAYLIERNGSALKNPEVRTIRSLKELCKLIEE
ncbi:MAG: hypothetical protein A3G33_01685 [Omnitrophica bacterium RIFCSPLOWO2_12_FULL_44_17]|uniref:HAD family hydrolase n=1 Tax=Candidatus Danuiimicrobium aquiferis TaxID=1801832 RepID=A0A1G1KV68_9BACT|nr:MAG: hypothetical protein A3B72_00920 [Omnitrophica bacterium RIFCSPHIGHO2_02_FULL_45_28]OGW88555.1 MAG: hypothetical protein A3E74_06555 [Omnitrophica bacterium RIFCSPHIGHO2_12_FULL_44_12]OGW96826.1 MAG: hypothetical protein A3G33_01685 [Omnitrophica bacterium RIFCSPLOWO2_12_FULL_44_17]OGX03828.1 MAG: hypothetical protein A3J12_09580 [Omnitrophica bacterium RIFCSPLOWO2_02_FULL_44_11]